ncbi:MAG: LysR family transcriptional regulator [Hyphomicrobiaceae bacterium]|nr:LysR family transcriptional regulator [Hyphomicrobiaceae bacterium]
MNSRLKASPHQIAAFTHAARERSFSKAAVALNVTQPAITQHVSKLEEMIGARLFIRRRSGLELTRAAKELFEISDRIHVLEQLLTERMRDYSELDSGQLSIVANAPCPAMGLISEFKRLYPGVHIDFSLGVWSDTMAQVKEREIDIGIITEPDDVDGMFKLEIDRTRYIALVPRDHAFAKRKSISTKELVRESLILPERGSLTRRVFEERMEELELAPASVTTVSSFPLSKEAVLHGVGIAVILEGAYSPSSRLKSVPIRDWNRTFRTYIVCPSDKKELRLVRSFLELSSVHSR